MLGLVYWPRGVVSDGAQKGVAHRVRDPRLGACFRLLGETRICGDGGSACQPAGRATYHGQPLLLPFDVGWHRYSKPTFEWIIPPQSPSNCYADTLKAHGEGVHHIGLPVDDLEQATAEYGKLGHQIVQSGRWGEDGKKNSGRYAYMDTDSIGGVTVELIHAIN